MIRNKNFALAALTLASVAIGKAEDMFVNIRCDGGYFLCAETGGAPSQPLVANRTVPLGWEQFRLIDLDGGELRYGDQVGFRTWNGTYVGVAPDTAVYTGSPWLLGWETFTLLDPNDVTDRSIINEDDPVCVRTIWGGFLQARNGGGADVAGGSVNMLQWESFYMDFLELPSVSDRGTFQAAAAATPRQWLSKNVPINERWALTGNLNVYGANRALEDMLVSSFIGVRDRKAKRIGRARLFYSSLDGRLTKVEAISPTMVQLYTGSAYQQVIGPDGSSVRVNGRARIRVSDRGNPLNGPTQRDKIEIWFTPTSSQPAEIRRLAQRRIKCELRVGNFEFRRNF